MTAPGEAPVQTPASGTEIGPYRVVGVIGRGGMGVVLEARHVRVNQRAALKILADARKAEVDDTAVRRFLGEIEVLSRLEHPGLVRVLDSGESPAHGPWLAMEYVSGEVLRAHLDRAGGQPVPIAFALRMTRRIASAVGAIHSAGIVHRDLKPENIMITPDDEVPGGQRVKLLDFGIAKLIVGDDRKTSEGTVLGTAGYMAPEQCTGIGDIDERADVYALGVILFELVCGQRPFAGSSSEVMRQHLFVPPPLDRLSSSLPPEVHALVGRMLAKEPTLRPSIARVIAQLRGLETALASAPEDEPALAMAATAPAPAVGATTVANRAVAVAAPVAPAPQTPAEAASVAASPARRRARWPWLIAGLAIAGALAGGVASMMARSSSRTTLHALPGMVVIDGARFRMGSTAAEIDAACAALPGGCADEERPQLARELPPREVTVSTFQLDAHEVTNREYAAFLNVIVSMIGVRDDRDDHYPRFVFDLGSGQTLLDLYVDGGIERAADGAFVPRAGRAEWPVVQVSWDGASHYCHHLGKRLPTEAEWELAARGRDGRRFPWGDAAPRCDGVVFGRGEPRGCAQLPIALAPVGTAAQDVTPEGIHDLGGNAGEWVQDQFVRPAYDDCGTCRDPVVAEPVAIDDDFRLFRGGTVNGVAYMTRTTTRSRWKRTGVLSGLGFRCAAR